jgi:hypothetical protein
MSFLQWMFVNGVVSYREHYECFVNEYILTIKRMAETNPKIIAAFLFLLSFDAFRKI